MVDSRIAREAVHVLRLRGNKAGNRTNSLDRDTNPPQHVSNSIKSMCGLQLLEFYTASTRHSTLCGILLHFSSARKDKSSRVSLLGREKEVEPGPRTTRFVA